MKKFILVLIMSVIVMGCSSVHHRKGHAISGRATCYESKYEGKTTANGELYDSGKMTCAAKDIEFGKKIRVENIATGKSVYVVVNDRGPKQDGWLVTLSEAAFKKIANKGETFVEVEIEVVE